jgi:hypothetical protein
VWTAAITSDGSSSSFLVVGNPGSCDEDVAGAGFTTPPAPDDPPLGLPADFGYIEAYTMECTNNVLLANGRPNLCASPNGNNDGGDDAIMGIATLVNAEAGFASSHNATSFVGFDAYSESASTRNSLGAGTVPITANYIPATPGRGNRTAVNRALAREGGVDKEILLGRWTASTLLDSTTQVVLTFPGNAQPGSNDPVSIWVFNEEENFNFSPREITLNWEVNICTFHNAGETSSGNTQLSCNGDNVGLGGAGGNEIVGPGGTFSGGWFRILNNNDQTAGDLIGGDGTGRETDDINAPPDSRFAVIGLVFSFFQGVNGIFDQSYPIQWAAIVGVGGIGGANCSTFTNVAFPIGCNSFNIQGEYAPWFLNPADLGDFVAPGDSFFGGLGLARDDTADEPDDVVGAN